MSFFVGNTPIYHLYVGDTEKFRGYIGTNLKYGKGHIDNFYPNNPDDTFFVIHNNPSQNIDNIYYYYWEDGLRGYNGYLTNLYSSVYTAYADWGLDFYGWCTTPYQSNGVCYMDSDGDFTSDWDAFRDNESTYRTGEPPSIDLYAQWYIVINKINWNKNSPIDSNLEDMFPITIYNHKNGNYYSLDDFYCAYHTQWMNRNLDNTAQDTVAPMAYGHWGLEWLGWYDSDDYSSATQFFSNSGGCLSGFTDYTNTRSNFNSSERPGSIDYDSLTLYAHWVIRAGSFIFNLNPPPGFDATDNSKYTNYYAYLGNGFKTINDEGVVGYWSGLATPSGEGLDFNGWYNQSWESDSEIQYFDNRGEPTSHWTDYENNKSNFYQASYPGTFKTLNLYAHWTIQKRTLSFAPGYSYSSDMTFWDIDDVSVDYNTLYRSALAGITPTCWFEEGTVIDGYPIAEDIGVDFYGWSTDSSSSYNYTDLRYSESKITQNQTLYAKFGYIAIFRLIRNGTQVYFSVAQFDARSATSTDVYNSAPTNATYSEDGSIWKVNFRDKFTFSSPDYCGYIQTYTVTLTG